MRAPRNRDRGVATGKLLAILAAVLAAALLAWWWFSPHVALREIHAAAQARDTGRLNAYLDYPSLRESMKGQFAARLGDKMQGARDNPMAALGMSFGLMVAGGLVDALVQPEVLMLALETGSIDTKALGAPRPREAAPGASAAAAPPNPPRKDDSPRWVMEREGADRVLVWPARDGRADRERVGFVLDRSGFVQWKLTEVRLPAF